MDISGGSALVTGGASGLGLASARHLAGAGARVVILDLPESAGASIADEIGAVFVAGDVTTAASVDAAARAAADLAPLRALIHCAGRGGRSRVVERDGAVGDRDMFEQIVRVNLLGTFNALTAAASVMSANQPVDGDRGVCVLTASVAAWEGQIGQAGYAASKAGIVGLTLVSARDLASHKIRVATIAPGIFDTPILARLGDEIRERLATGIPHPSRLGSPDEFADLAMSIIRNPMINGETIRLDGAIRMGAR